MEKRLFLKGALQQDDVLIQSELKDLHELTGIMPRKGLEQALISNGKIVNIVSNNYGHLDNNNYFPVMEAALDAAGIKYKTRKINIDDCNFAVDYILDDESIAIKVKGNDDIIMPMMRMINSYDGKTKAAGHFGFYRKVCENGLHIAESQIGYKLRHKRNIEELIIENIDVMVKSFIENEYYSLHRKFEVLAETQIKDVSHFVERVCSFTGLFNYAKSEKNPDPSKKAQLVIDKIDTEAKLLHTAPNMWLGYNAFNAVLHEEFQGKNFEEKHNIDERMFNMIHKFHDIGVLN